MTATTTARAVVYARVSTTEQARPDATSIGAQLERGQKYAEAQGWEVIAQYTDEGVSGAKQLSERAKGQRLPTESYDVVIFWAMDRFTRSAARGLADLETLEAQGKTVVFVKEAIDTSTPSGRLFRTMLAAFAELERETIRERNMGGKRAGIDGSLTEGGRATRWVQGFPPLGYRIGEKGTPEAGRVLEDPEQADNVRRIFELRAAGQPTTAIARILQAEDRWPRPRKGISNPFNRKIVTDTLRRVAYMGGGIERYLDGHAARLHQQPKDPATGLRPAPARCKKCTDAEPDIFDAPALITPELWRAAEKGRIKGRRRIVPNAGKRNNRRYAPSQRVRHAHGDGETSNMYADPRTVRWYRCKASRKTETTVATCDGFGKGYGPNSMTAVAADLVEARVLLWALDLLEDREALAEYVRIADRALVADADGTEDIEAARRKLAKLKTKRQRYHDGFAADPNASIESLRENLDRLNAEAETLAGVIARAEEVEGQRVTLRHSIEELLAMTVEPDDASAGNDWNEYPPNRAQEFDLLRQAAAHTLSPENQTPRGRSPELSAHAVEAAKTFARVLGIEVTLYHPGPDGDPRRPRMSVGFSPTFAPLANGELSA